MDLSFKLPDEKLKEKFVFFEIFFKKSERSTQMKEKNFSDLT